MANKIYYTYQLESDPYEDNISLGYMDAIHCDYVGVINTESLSGVSISLFFDNIEFPFLNDTISGATNQGWSANRLNALIQIVEDGNELLSNAWKTMDITSQIPNHTVGNPISPTNLTGVLFNIKIEDYDASEIYNLDYLSYPSDNVLDSNKMALGEEVFFFGNVKTDIQATIYTSDIPIVLPLSEFNQTTNPTWDGNSEVAISEIGIYDDNNNLVAIAKLSNPITKDNNTARTILVQLDF